MAHKGFDCYQQFAWFWLIFGDYYVGKETSEESTHQYHVTGDFNKQLQLFISLVEDDAKSESMSVWLM